MATLIIILGLISIVVLFVWISISMMIQSKKDWKTLKDLEERSHNLSTKEEIEAFSKEFIEKALQIDNPIIQSRLLEIDGYLRGLYKQYKP